MKEIYREMNKLQTLWLIPALVIYIIYRRFRLTDLEFAIIAFALLFVITLVNAANPASQELFTEQDTAISDDSIRKMQTLLELPGYIKTKIGDQIDGLIKDVKDTGSSNDDVISKETETDNPIVAKDSVVDTAKFALLKREFITIDAMLKNMKDADNTVYVRIFGADEATTKEQQEANAEMQAE